MNTGVILCVDDEETILSSLQMQIEEMFGDAFVIELALGATEAYEILGHYEVGAVTLLVIISDWQMPRIRGDEFLIEAHRRFPRVVKIMLSGQADRAAVDNARREANLFRLINKPWDKDELHDAIAAGLKEQLDGE